MNNFYNNISFVDYIPVVHERNVGFKSINPFLSYPQTSSERELNTGNNSTQEQLAQSSPSAEQPVEQSPVTESTPIKQSVTITGKFEQPTRQLGAEMEVPKELREYHQISDTAKFTEDGIKILYAAKYYGIPLRVSSSYRTSWNPNSRSWHKTGQAVDITPQYSSEDPEVRKKEWEDFKYKILSNKSFIHWLTTNKYGILDETDPEIKKRTKASGDHWHIGPDNWAQSWLGKAMKEWKDELATEYHPYYAYEKRNTLSVPHKDDPSGNNDRFYNTMIPIYKKILTERNIPTKYIKDLLLDLRKQDMYGLGYDGEYYLGDYHYNSLYELLNAHVNQLVSNKLSPTNQILSGSFNTKSHAKTIQELNEYMKRNKISSWRRGGMINKYLK